EDNDQLDESERVVAVLVPGADITQAFDTNAATTSGENFRRHSSFELHHFGEAGHVCCSRPVMMLMSGVKRASTIVPTITARNTIMMGSSAEVRAITALSTSSSKTSATFKSISGSLPVSSPTSTMLTTIGGKT